MIERKDAAAHWIYTKRGLIYIGQSQRMQLYRATLLHTGATKLREKIAGVTSV